MQLGGTRQSIAFRFFATLPSYICLISLLSRLLAVVLRDRDVAEAHTTYIPQLGDDHMGESRLGGATSDFHQPALVIIGEFLFVIKERPGPLRCTSCHLQK